MAILLVGPAITPCIQGESLTDAEPVPRHLAHSYIADADIWWLMDQQLVSNFGVKLTLAHSM